VRIAVVSECHVGSAWAHAINVIKTAGGFARLGHEVTILCRPHPDGIEPTTALGGYGESALAVETAPPSVRAGDASAFAQWAVGHAARMDAEFLYCRHFEAATLAATKGLSAALETHAYAGDRNPALLAALEATAHARRPLTIVTIHPALREYYASAGGSFERIHVVPDGVDVEMFSPPAILPTPPWSDDAPDRPRAVYAGRLFAYKGVDTLAHAAALAPQWIVEILGGPQAEQERLESMIRTLGISNVRLRGQRPLSEIPRWLWHAQALVLAPSALEPSAGWTSPVKLGEYLAAGPQIIASDIPGLRAWVDEPAVRWVAPDDAAALATGLQAALGERELVHIVRRNHARALAERFSYGRRASAIIIAARLSASAPARATVS
jgi:glycosyltransferase involved in cell wall biosynthesis